MPISSECTLMLEFIKKLEEIWLVLVMTQTLAALSVEESEATLVILVLTLVILLPILFMLSFMLFIFASIPDKANEKSAGTELLS